ncbi:hypothetical protein CHH58_16095 [Terribacillus saccharophilus]|uniref:hypothetical protein n=1 Tax=Terribacillus saccharophilus TaxID=361277 RepID=UPI000BA6F895|nr:hypothetical protein [Terribacillus saccharophilus]PAF35575.1 hypothetical protein CHH58_16095 [Terribacillus saccharophilus]
MITVKTAKRYANARAEANKQLDEYVRSFEKYFKDEKYNYYEIICMIENHVKAFDKKESAPGLVSLLLSFIAAVCASAFTRYFFDPDNPQSAINLLGVFSDQPILSSIIYSFILGLGIGVVIVPFYLLWWKWDGSMRHEIYKRNILLEILEEKKKLHC